MTSPELQQKLIDLETRIKALEKKEPSVDSHTKWKVILLLGAWLIAALFCFANIGQENMKEVIGSASTVTILILLFF